MPPVVTFSPENPRPALDGINIYVSGEVSVPGRVVIYRNEDEKLIGQSPAFGQDGPSRNAEVEVALTGNPTGGTWTLELEYNGSDSGTTAAIPWDATAVEIESALAGVVGTRAVRVVGDAPGPITIVFEGHDWGDREVTVTGADSLTGGTSPAVSVETTHAGGKDVDAITSLILPALLLPEGVYDVDLVYAGGDDDGESMLEDMVQIYVEE